jgi:hypothetical protein
VVAYIFQQLSQRGRAEGIDDSIRQRDARTWFRNAAQDVKSVNTNRMMSDPENLKTYITITDIGRMYMFFYNPKHKETLPYYDTFPLIFPIGFKDGGFLGLNLHYLPYILRAKLMDSLYSISNNNKYDDSTKLKVSYEILNGASRYKYFKPCLKQYLWNHVTGKFMNVQPRNWDAALMLPTERFRKASKDMVWKDSKGMF